MSSRSEAWPVGWKPTGTPSSSIASHSGSSSGSCTWRPLIGLGLPMTATAPSSRTARRAARVRNLVMRRPRERATLEILAHGSGVRALGHLADLEVTDADERLVRGVLGAPGERRRERLERLVEVADPEVVGLHRVQIAVHDLEPVLHVRAPPGGRGDDVDLVGATIT